VIRIRAAAMVLAALTPAAAAADVASDRAGLAALQADDLRLQTIGWRLATGNARFCASAPPAIGLLLQDMANYTDPAAMRAAVRITGDVAVEAAVAGAPAARAGLAVNDEIVAIDGNAMSALPPARPGDWRRLTGLHDAIDAALARDRSVRIQWRDAQGAMHDRIVAGVPACRTRFELLSGGSNAAADGTRVVIGRKFAGISYPENELAAALAHEMAHNMLAHRAWLTARGRGQKNVRLTEREADRLMPWLLANAGYDPRAAERFFVRWGPRHDGGLLRARDHDGWDERADFVRAELPQVERLLAGEGAADWRTHFVRDTGG
jgi:hypothetical protein